MRTRIVSDIRKKTGNLKRNISSRVDLSSSVKIIVPLKGFFSYATATFLLFSFVFGSAYAPISGGSLLAASTTAAERSELEAQLRDLEKQIADYEGTVAQYKSQGKTLESEIKVLNAKIAKLNLQIKAINLNLSNLNREIETTKIKISNTESNISDQKTYLSSIIQSLYESDKKGLLEMMMENPRFSDFFLDVNNLLAVQDNVRVALESIINLKEELMGQKEALAIEYDDVAQLKAYQENQSVSVKKLENDKKVILQATKGQESKYQQLLTETKKTAAQIRSRIYELLGGGELSFGEAYKLAKAAEDATGVRTALILAVLDRESALGKNVGRCFYDRNPYYPARASNPTTMNPTRDIPAFLEIIKELGLDPKTTPVSCPIPSDGAYGGAMGPAQFIPSTWKVYRNDIAALTGANPPSPWNNLHAFMATALYLKNAGAAKGNLNDEKIAAAKYYAGSNWQRHLNTYGARVISRAQEFQEDINILGG